MTATASFDRNTPLEPDLRTPDAAPNGSARPAAVLGIVTAALFTDTLLYNMVVAFLPQQLRQGGESSVEIGLLFAAYAGGLLLSAPPAGRLADRLGGRTMLAAGAICLALASLVGAFAANASVMVVGRFLQGSAGAALWAAGLAWLAEVYPTSTRGKALGTAMAGLSVGALVGPILGGTLFEWGGQDLPLLTGAGLAGLLAVLTLLMPRRRSRVALRNLSFRSVLAQPGVAVTLGVVLLGSIVLSLLDPTLPLHLETRLHAGPIAVGLAFAAATLAYGLSAPLAGSISDRSGRRKTMAAGVLATVVSLPLVALPAHWWLEIPALVLLGIACAFLLTPTLPQLADAVEGSSESGYGRAYTLFNLAYALGMFVGPTVGGALSDQFGFGASLFILSAAAAPYLLVVVRSKCR